MSLEYLPFVYFKVQSLVKKIESNKLQKLLGANTFYVIIIIIKNGEFKALEINFISIFD